MRGFCLLFIAAGCAAVSPHRPARLSQAATVELAAATRVCALGNGGACADLEQQLRGTASPQLAARLSAELRDSGYRPDRFSAGVERCRAGESRDCDQVAQALAVVAGGSAGGDPVVEALLELVDRDVTTESSGALSAR
jgi:hypothetical protein